MRGRIPDTMFTRLFGLAMAVLLISHLVTTSLFLIFGPGREHRPPPPPPPRYEAGVTPPPEGHRPPERRLRFPPEFWWAQLLTVVLVSLLALYGARRLAQPITRLTAAARLLGNNLQAPPLAEQGPAETREAARLFNQMQQKLRRQLEERSRFLAAVSHDLRTPLTRIRLRSLQIDDDALQQKMAKDIHDMAQMLDATLAYLRDDAHAGKWQWLDVDALLEVLAEDWAEQQLQLHISGEAGRLFTQPESLRRCLDNLLENVLRYGGGKATLSLQLHEEQLWLNLHDAGPGIPDEQLAQVFEPFYRLEDSRNRHSGGTGLGLTIARDIAHRLGGELMLANHPEGGLQASLRLPRLPAGSVYPS